MRLGNVSQQFSGVPLRNYFLQCTHNYIDSSSVLSYDVNTGVFIYIVGVKSANNCLLFIA